MSMKHYKSEIRPVLAFCQIDSWHYGNIYIGIYWHVHEKLSLVF